MLSKLCTSCANMIASLFVTLTLCRTNFYLKVRLAGTHGT